jgi:hypothetical protein
MVDPEGLLLRQPPGMSYGAYCTKRSATCFPGGARLSSSAEGSVISMMGRREGAPPAERAFKSTARAHAATLGLLLWPRPRGSVQCEG